jgi:hypothetical protein
MIVSGGHPSEQDGGLQEVTVNGQRHSYRDPFSGVPYWMNASYWAHAPYGMRPAGYDEGGGGEGSGDEEIIDVKIPKPDFCVDGLFLSKNADAANLNVNWQKAFQYMSAQQLNELAATLQSIKTGTFPASGTGGWQLNLPTGTPQSLLDSMMKEARDAAKLSPENRWAYGGNFGDLLTNGMKAYTYVPWLNLQPQLAKIFGKSCNQSA